MFKAIMLITIIITAPFGVSAAIIHVPADQPTIQAGIDAAVEGDTVLVADGTYTGDGNRDIDFKGKAITVTSENGPETCIIDCQGVTGHRGFYFHTYETENAIVQGFSIKNGSPWINHKGGGIYCLESSPTIRDCDISENNTKEGPGIYCLRSSPTVTNCVISNNSFSGFHMSAAIAFEDSSLTIANCIISGKKMSNSYGRGIYCRNSSLVISDCSISVNNEGFGEGGIFCVNSSVKMTHCIFSLNKVNVGGGVNSYESSLDIDNCTFSMNEAWNYAGGVYCYFSSVKIANSIFSYNKALYEGGGICCTHSSMDINNCTFLSNEADFGGGVFSHYFSSAALTNCTFTLNKATSQVGGGIYSRDSENLSISNSILWGDYGSEVPIRTYHINISYSDIQGGFPGIGNINVDPLFVGGDPFDNHLSPNSPCIDAGTDADVSATDLEGFARQQGGAVDMGAYESTGWPLETRAYIKMPSHLFRPGDIASCIGSVWNPHEYVLDEYLFFAVLDIWGTYYCAPSYTEIDYYFLDCNPGLTEIPIMPEFTWPSGVGSATGIVWYAALINPEMTELVSEIGVFDFGWSE